MVEQALEEELTEHLAARAPAASATARNFLSSGAQGSASMARAALSAAIRNISVWKHGVHSPRVLEVFSNGALSPHAAPHLQQTWVIVPGPHSLAPATQAV